MPSKQSFCEPVIRGIVCDKRSSTVPFIGIVRVPRNAFYHYNNNYECVQCGNCLSGISR